MKDCNLPAPGSPRFTIEYLSGKGYVVLDPENRVVWGPNATLAFAEDKRDGLQADTDRKAKRGPRPCLCCGATFQSEGIHNRMCPRCRSLSDPLDATGFAGGQDGRKPRRAARV